MIFCLYFFVPGSECKVPAGVLTVSLELCPPLTATLSPDVVSTQVGTQGISSTLLSVCPYALLLQDTISS